MSIQPIDPRLAHLPGEPRAAAGRELPGEANAKAKLETIKAFHQIQLWRWSRDFDPADWSVLSVEEKDLLTEDNQSEAEACHDSIDNFLWRHTHGIDCYHAGIDYSATWSQGTVPDGQPDKFYVTLSGGGPSCGIRGDFGLHGCIDDDSLQLEFSWASQTRRLPLEQDDRDALAWFCGEVCC